MGLAEGKNELTEVKIGTRGQHDKYSIRGKQGGNW